MRILVCLVLIGAMMGLLSRLDERPDDIASKKLTHSMLLVSCNDEHEPVAQTSENKTEIIIVCVQK